MRKIGSITPIWNQEMFIGPHFDMLKDLDKNIVFMQQGPLPNYDEHGIGEEPDLSEKILKEKYSNVEIYYSRYDLKNDFTNELYNECLSQVQDCDIVFRLDPDMFFLEKDWKALLDFIDTTDFDCYRMNFKRDSINYYMSWDYDHGLKDATEFDPLATNPKQPFLNILDYPNDNYTIIDIPNWVCHHLRGWNKPQSTPPNWAETHEYLTSEYGDEKGKWFKVPEEIKDRMESWRQELERLRNDF